MAVLTKSANGTTIEASVGTPIHIHLDGNPTTGYAWTVKDENTALTAIAIEYKAPNTGMMGAGGTYHISVTPKAAGKIPVHFVYSRSFESGKPPVEEFSVTLNVA